MNEYWKVLLVLVNYFTVRVDSLGSNSRVGWADCLCYGLPVPARHNSGDTSLGNGLEWQDRSGVWRLVGGGLTGIWRSNKAIKAKRLWSHAISSGTSSLSCDSEQFDSLRQLLWLRSDIREYNHNMNEFFQFIQRLRPKKKCLLH